jgi:hypothetical protein
MDDEADQTLASALPATLKLHPSQQTPDLSRRPNGH